MREERQIDISILRVLACFSVFAIHLGQRANFQGIIRKFTDFGEQGAYLFFIISGFVCFCSFEKNNFILTKTSYCNYVLKRIFRILPLYYAIIILDMVIHTFVFHDVPPDSAGLYWGNYFFLLSRIVPSDNGFWNNLSATWTISVFMMFYLIAPFLWKVIKNLKTALVFCIAFMGADILIGSFCDMMEPFRLLYYFVYGIIVYYVLKEKEQGKAYAVLSVLLLLQGIISGEFSLVTFSIIFVLLLIGFNDFSVKNEKIVKAIHILDSYSYTIYLCHAVVIEMIDKINIVKGNPVLWRIQVLLIAVLGTAGLCVIMKYGVEKPMNHVYKQITGKSNC